MKAARNLPQWLRRGKRGGWWMTKDGANKGKDAATERAERLAAALRANLKRRRSQARARVRRDAAATRRGGEG